MPDPVEPDKQQHYDAHHHPVVTQFRTPCRFPVAVLKDLLKSDQIQKLYQCQYPVECAQGFTTGLIRRGSTDFSCL